MYRGIQDVCHITSRNIGYYRFYFKGYGILGSIFWLLSGILSNLENDYGDICYICSLLGILACLLLWIWPYTSLTYAYRICANSIPTHGAGLEVSNLALSLHHYHFVVCASDKGCDEPVYMCRLA